MGFASGFATGFINQASLGMENENKARLERERDFDRIATTNIFETARDFLKEHARVTGDLKKKAELYNTFLPLVHNNQAAAEILAHAKVDPSDTDKISEVFSRFNNPEAQKYQSGLMTQMQQQLEQQNKLTQSAVDKANSLIPKGSKLTPFEHADYSPMNVTPSTIPPSMPSISARVHNEVMKGIVDNPGKFPDAASAKNAYKAQLSALAPNMPINDQEIDNRLAGITWGKQNIKDPASETNIQNIADALLARNKDMSPSEARIQATEKYYNITPRNEHKNAEYQIDSIISGVGKANWIWHPETNTSSFKALDSMNTGLESALQHAAAIARTSMAHDMANRDSTKIMQPAEYAVWGMFKAGVWGNPKNPEAQKRYYDEMALLEKPGDRTVPPADPTVPRDNTPAAKKAAERAARAGATAPAQQPQVPTPNTPKFVPDPNRPNTYIEQ